MTEGRGQLDGGTCRRHASTDTVPAQRDKKASTAPSSIHHRASGQTSKDEKKKKTEYRAQLAPGPRQATERAGVGNFLGPGE